MNINEQIEYWFDLAEDDIIVAESNLKQKNFLWCLFICHISIEKSLKALYTQIIKEVPPKIHDLVKLVKLIEIKIPENDIKFLFEMNRFNIEARYPEYKNSIKQMATLEFTTEKFLKTKEILKWLKSLKK